MVSCCCWLLSSEWFTTETSKWAWVSISDTATTAVLYSSPTAFFIVIPVRNQMVNILFLYGVLFHFISFFFSLICQLLFKINVQIIYRLVNYGVVLLLVVSLILDGRLLGYRCLVGMVDTKPQRRRLTTQQHTQQPDIAPPRPQVLHHILWCPDANYYTEVTKYNSASSYTTGVLHHQGPGLLYHQGPGLLHQQGPGVLHQQGPGVLHHQGTGVLHDYICCPSLLDQGSQVLLQDSICHTFYLIATGSTQNLPFTLLILSFKYLPLSIYLTLQDLNSCDLS